MKTTRRLAHAVASTSTPGPRYRADIRTGHHDLVADESAASGGQDTGPSPFHLLSSALAACTAITLRMYADRKGWELTTLEVDVRYDVDEDGQTAFERTITVPAEVEPEQRQRLGEIAEKTPVTLAVRNGTPINTTVR